MLEHGGKLIKAAQQYGIPLKEWLDLSTGINPHSWLLSERADLSAMPADCWTRLPEEDDGLTAAAARYYGVDHRAILPLAGSQAAIQALPTLPTLWANLGAPCRIGIPFPAYAEHAFAWQNAGHIVHIFDEMAANLESLDVLLIINPNNPSGARFSPAQLLGWHADLARRGGRLIVDEAFMDATPSESLAPAAASGQYPGLLVLRSFGKFFGLPGARLGFLIGANNDLPADLPAGLPADLAALQEKLGPWSINGATRWLAQQAFADQDWQQETRVRLTQASARLRGLLSQAGLTQYDRQLSDLAAPKNGGCALFHWVCTPAAARIAERLARQGIWVRYFAEPQSLRFGLPGAESEWQRFEAALAIACQSN